MRGILVYRGFIVYILTTSIIEESLYRNNLCWANNQTNCKEENIHTCKYRFSQ